MATSTKLIVRGGGFPQLPPSAMTNSSLFDYIGEDPHSKINIKDSAGLKTGDYDSDTLSGLFKAAKVTGIDGYQLAALALQESGLGSAMIKMRRGKQQADLAMIHDFSPQQQSELDVLSKKTGVDARYLKPAIALRDKLKYAQQLGFKDEPSMLQAYNGYGIITKDKFGGSDKAYGVPIGEGIDLRKNPLYGKRIVQLANDLRSNQNISNLVKSLK